MMIKTELLVVLLLVLFIACRNEYELSQSSRVESVEYNLRQQHIMINNEKQKTP